MPRKKHTPEEIVAKLRREGRSVEVVGYNRASADLIDRFALHDKTGVEMGVVLSRLNTLGLLFGAADMSTARAGGSAERPVIHALRRLPGRKIIFSNAPRHYAEAILDITGLGGEQQYAEHRT